MWEKSRGVTCGRRFFGEGGAHVWRVSDLDPASLELIFDLFGNGCRRSTLTTCVTIAVDSTNGGSRAIGRGIHRRCEDLGSGREGWLGSGREMWLGSGRERVVGQWEGEGG